MITIEVIQEYIKTNIIPIKDGEILLLRDIVKDRKILGEKSKNKLDLDFTEILDLLDYEIDIDYSRYERLINDKSIRFIKSSRFRKCVKSYKQRF